MAVREPLGLQGHDDVAENAGDADGPRLPSSQVALTPKLSGRQAIGGATGKFTTRPNENRIEKLQAGYEQVSCSRQQARHPDVATKQSDHPSIHA